MFFTLEQPLRLTIQNASTDNRLIGTEGQHLHIECVAVQGIPAPMLSLVVLETTVKTGVQELGYILRNIPRIYHTTNVSCIANSDALDIPMTNTALIYLNRRYQYVCIIGSMNMLNQCRPTKLMRNIMIIKFNFFSTMY